MASTHASLDAAATERKARLAKLASLKRKQPHPSPPPNSNNDNDNDNNDTTTTTTTTNGNNTSHLQSPLTPSTSIPPPTQAPSHLSNRNYDPVSRGPKLGFEQPPLAENQPTLESRAAALTASTFTTETSNGNGTAGAAEKERGIELSDLAPRKPNWDLKRDVARKMAVLGQRTDNAIARLVRERVEGSKKKEGGRNGERSGDGGGEGEAVGIGMEGVDLVEGVHVREREVEEEERLEREMDGVGEEGDD